MTTATSEFGVSKRESHDSKAYYERGLLTVVEDKKSLPLKPAPESIDALYCQSATNMSQVRDNSVALTVTSPPYHVGKEYDGDESLEEFVDNVLRPVFDDVRRVLEPGGRLAVNVAGLGRKPYFNFPNIVDSLLLDIGFLPRGEIIWQKAEGSNGSCAWGSWCSDANPVMRDLHEKVLLYSKDRYDRHPYRKVKGQPQDKESFMRDTLSVWKIAPESAKRVGHPAPFPVELPKRLIELFTHEKDLVLDPFLGVGATAVAAKRTGRHYVGYDIVEAYLDTARTRLEQE